jgi:acyl carrier protein
MSHTDFFGLFNHAALQVSGMKFENLDNTTVISSLGLDSVAVMELIGYLEEKLDIRIPDEDLAALQTLGDLDGIVKRLTAKELP